MRYRLAITLLSILLPVFLLLRCSEKYVGFNYNAELPDQGVLISGKVVNTFTDEPVASAIVDINGQITSTNPYGEYTFTYTVASDEGFSRPIPVTITKANYFPLHTSLIIYPLDNTLDARLVYAAPVIQNSAIVDSFCNAEVFDYQGVSDINSVFTINAYLNSDSGFYFFDTLAMPFIQEIDANTGLYQVAVPDSISNGQLARSTYRILAIDKSNYQDIRMFRY